jgi:HK97 gp10 family phage protein
MARHCVTIKGLDRTVRTLNAAGADLPKIVDESLKKSAKKIVHDAKRKIVEYDAYDTGLLKNSIIETHPRQCQWIVAARKPYAIYVEFGTGSAGDPEVPHTTRPKWVYFSKIDGGFRTAYPQPARPFMRTTFAENKAVVVENLKSDIIAAALRAFRGGK